MIKHIPVREEPEAYFAEIASWPTSLELPAEATEDFLIDELILVARRLVQREALRNHSRDTGGRGGERAVMAQRAAYGIMVAPQTKPRLPPAPMAKPPSLCGIQFPATRVPSPSGEATASWYPCPWPVPAFKPRRPNCRDTLSRESQPRPCPRT